MCRLIALTSEEPLSPMIALRALDVMREGHDGSGVGLLFCPEKPGPLGQVRDRWLCLGVCV